MLGLYHKNDYDNQSFTVSVITKVTYYANIIICPTSYGFCSLSLSTFVLAFIFALLVPYISRSSLDPSSFA
jgi:hypothetical protein